VVSSEFIVTLDLEFGDKSSWKVEVFGRGLELLRQDLQLV